MTALIMPISAPGTQTDPLEGGIGESPVHTPLQWLSVHRRQGGPAPCQSYCM